MHSKKYRHIKHTLDKQRRKEYIPLKRYNPLFLPRISYPSTLSFKRDLILLRGKRYQCMRKNLFSMRRREEILTASHTKENNSFPKFYYVKLRKREVCEAVSISSLLRIENLFSFSQGILGISSLVKETRKGYTHPYLYYLFSTLLKK